MLLREPSPTPVSLLRPLAAVLLTASLFWAAPELRAQGRAGTTREQAQAGRIHREGAVLRAEPGFAGAALTTLAVGQELTFRAEPTSEWVRVTLKAGGEGWLHELFVEAVAGRAEQPPVPGGGSQEAPAPARPQPEVTPAPDERMIPLSEARALADRRAGSAEKLVEEMTRRTNTAEDEVASLQLRVQALEDALDAARELLRLEVSAEVERRLSVQEEASRRALASSGAKHETALASLRAEHALALEEQAAQHDQELEALAEKGRQDLAAEVERSKALADEFIGRCAQLHERELTRLTETLTAEKEEALAALRRDHEMALARVGKESGWEKDFKAAVKEAADARVKEAVDEAVFRSKTGRRADKDAHERELERVSSRLEADCESKTAEAVRVALAAREAEEGVRLNAARQEARSVCLRALELALARGPDGVDPEQIQELRETWEGGESRPGESQP